MTQNKRTALTWLLRLIGLGLIAFVIVTQVKWYDRVVLLDGTTLVGDLSTDPVSGWVMRPEGSEVTRFIDVKEVAVRQGNVPDITYGFRTLGLRVLQQPMTGILILLAMAVIVVLTGWRWQRLLRATDVPLPLGEAVRLTFIGGFFNLVVPGSTGGDVVKAYYAARRTGAATRSVLSVFVDRAVGLFTLVLVAAVALFAEDHEGYEAARITVLALLAGGVVAIVFVFSERVRRLFGLSALIRKLPFQRVIDEIGASVRLYRGHPGALLHAFLISVVNQGTFALIAWALADALSIEGVSLMACLALVPLVNLVAAVPLIPGGWGVGELAFAYFFGQIGVPATEAVGLSVIYRLSFLVVNLPGGIFWLFLRSHTSRDKIAAAVEEAAEHVGDLQAPESPNV